MGLINILDQEYIEAFSKFPKLRKPFLYHELGILEGEIDIVDKNDWCWGTYEVRIVFPPTYPAALPRCFEVSEKIFRHEDWHVNKEGLCCLGTDAKQFRELANRFTLVNWLVLFVVPFFANHIHRLEIKRYADGELSHGPKGLYEDYSALLDITDIHQLVERLRLMAGVSAISMNRLCFCGSGKKYKRCYVVSPETHMMGIPQGLIITDVQKLSTLKGSVKE